MEKSLNHGWTQMDADEECFGLKVKSSRLDGEDQSDMSDPSDRSHLFFFFTTDSLDVFDLYQEARQTMVKGWGLVVRAFLNY